MTRDHNAVCPAVQLCMTHLPTIERVQRILIDDLGVRSLGYTYQERKSHHKDAHHLRVNRQTDQLAMALALVPYAVT